MQLPSINEIEPSIFIGNEASACDIPTLKANHITAIISLGDGPCPVESTRLNKSLVPSISILFFECLDSSTQDLLPGMGSMCDFIDQVRSDLGKGKGNVLVHCGEGISRSGAVVVAYFMRKYRISAPKALGLVQRKRRVLPNSNFMDQLQVWERVEYQI